MTDNEKKLIQARHRLEEVQARDRVKQRKARTRRLIQEGAVLEKRKGAKATMIDGYSNFLFLNRDGCPKTNVNYATMFRGLAKKYNKCHEEALPKVMTPHTLRHTFCTNLANAGMNPKALQYIMGHSNITMTLNYYAHATFASARAEMERLIA